MEVIKRQELLFDLEQSKARSLIRIKELRAGPVDVMLGNLHMAVDPVFALELAMAGYEMATEHLNISLLSTDELNAIKKDLEYLMLDNVFKEFWEKIQVWILAEISKRETFGISPAILNDLNSMLSGKSLQELHILRIEIIDKINSGGMIDFDYWNVAQKLLEVALADKEVEKIYQGFWESYMERVKKQKRGVIDGSITYPLMPPKAIPQTNKLEELEQSSDSSLNEIPPHQIPQRMKIIPQEYKHLPIMKESEFNAILLKMINESSLLFIHPKLEGEGGVVEKRIKSKEEEEREKDFHRDAASEITPEEKVFIKDEVFLPCSPNIDIKFRLRKPRYHNSVKTIVEWNKHNSARYNEFNTPPKIVDGYKFNLYYPDLIDKSKPPNYQISPDTTEATRILRFTAGKPYADIAFRIVNKPWDICHRRGFRVDFEK